MGDTTGLAIVVGIFSLACLIARAKEAKARAAAKRAETRLRLKALGAVKIPPVLIPGMLPPVDPTEEAYSVMETTRLLHRSHATVVAWLRDGRVRHTIAGTAKKPAYRIPISEARRIAALLGVPDPAASRPDNIVTVPADDPHVAA